VYCIAHIAEHDGCGGGSGCFPNHALRVGQAGVEASLSEAMKPPGEPMSLWARGAITQALNFLSPGHRALASTAQSHGINFGKTVTVELGETRETFTIVSKEFLGQDTLVKVGSLWAREWRSAMRTLTEAAPDDAARYKAAPFGRDVMARVLWAGFGVYRQVEAPHEFLIQRERLAFSALLRMQQEEIPEDRDEIALWLASEGERERETLTYSER
jgi:hypothetical protein